MATLKKIINPKNCPHIHFVAKTNVIRLNKDKKGAGPDSPADAFAAEVEIKCTDCGTPFQFMGVEVGYSPKKPTGSADYTQLRAPIAPIL